jgi:ABC-2 type transport system ATP-binding protein
VIRAEGLTKRFATGRTPPVTAVEGLDLEVSQGEIFGFLGPNGAGKTTTVRMLTSLIRPTDGQAWVNGLDVGRQDTEVRRTVGVLTETPGLYERMSALDNLAFYARLYGVADVPGQVRKYLELTRLWERRSDAVSGFSKGMKQKLAIARALVHEPKTVFLDEPTAALDPEAAMTVREFIDELKSEGRTIFICTHDLDEADRLCDRVAVFNTRLIAADTPANLRRALFGRKVVVQLRGGGRAWTSLARSLPFVREADTVDGRLVVSLDDPENQNPELVRRLVEAGAEVQFVGELQPSLEDVYFRLLRGTG